MATPKKPIIKDNAKQPIPKKVTNKILVDSKKKAKEAMDKKKAMDNKSSVKPKAPTTKPAVKPKVKQYKDATDRPGFQFGKGTI